MIYRHRNRGKGQGFTRREEWIVFIGCITVVVAYCSYIAWIICHERI